MSAHQDSRRSGHDASEPPRGTGSLPEPQTGTGSQPEQPQSEQPQPEPGPQKRKRYVCIHGHFYQPPRENPWLETVEVQDSAYPYHDWNERVTAEAYAPNTASRMLDAEGRIARIVNNYARVSFNIGPTLLSWMQEAVPDVYKAIRDADGESARLFGRGSAIAQAYHHLIMPLANNRDKRTEILWGVADFRHRFGRDPEGMWLPETAVDLETLDLLAESGIAFTILSPFQASRVREGPDAPWHDATQARIDPTRPYRQRLPSGRSITLFFYDAPVSQAVAFERLLTDGSRFADRLVGALRDDRTWDQIIHIATDGESYGHHHAHGDMALAVALQRLESDWDVKLTNYASYLARHPPKAEAEITERTAWSCFHGVGRWSGDCGCNTGGKPGWNQRWRGPLRATFDRLRDTLAPLYEERAGKHFPHPWKARDEYIEVVLDRSRTDAFLARHAHPDKPLDEVEALKLLEMQRHLLMMYTSCGWFFDEVSGVETTQVLLYASRAVQLAEELFGNGLHQQFLQDLEKVPSNLAEFRTARGVYEQLVAPNQVDLRKVAAHDAIAGLFGIPAGDGLPGYEVRRQPSLARQHGRSRMGAGRVHIVARATREKGSFDYTAVHFGDHNVLAGIRTAPAPPAPGPELSPQLLESFDRADIASTVRLLDSAFPGRTFSLISMFRDRQRLVVRMLLDETLREARAAYGSVYDRNARLIRFLGTARSRVPKPLRIAAEFVLRQRLRDALAAETVDLERIRSLVEEGRHAEVKLDTQGLGFALGQALERLQADWLAHPEDLVRLRTFVDLCVLQRDLPFTADLWRVQNRFYAAARQPAPGPPSPEWQEAMRQAADALAVQVPQ